MRERGRGEREREREREREGGVREIERVVSHTQRRVGRGRRERGEWERETENSVFYF